MVVVALVVMMMMLKLLLLEGHICKICGGGGEYGGWKVGHK